MDVVVDSEQKVARIQAQEEVARNRLKVKTALPGEQDEDQVDGQVPPWTLLGPFFFFEDVKSVVRILDPDHCQCVHHYEVHAQVVHPMVQWSTQGLVIDLSINWKTVAKRCAAHLKNYRWITFLDTRLCDKDKDEEESEHSLDRVAKWDVSKDCRVITHV